jgi:penicillin-binding protein 1A
MNKKNIAVRITAVFTIIITIIIGVGLGLSLAMTRNVMNEENFTEFAVALPTKIVDINGELITEFSSEEKREMISLSDLPKHLIHATLAREDPTFFSHKGFSLRGILRAVYGRLIGQDLGGGSTITQQVAGTLYTDRTEISIKRKVVELWWALQMERRFSKNEILEIYLNYMIMGPGVYGVEAASQYFFGHSARDITLAEAAVLVIQLSSPARYNPLANPDVAMGRQRVVLDRMIELGYTTAEEAEMSFNEYWANYDYTRAATSAFYNREDAAPWFSEYVRRELDSSMYGSMDYYRDGYTVQTTIDLKHQQAAQRLMEQRIAYANTEFNKSFGDRLVTAERTYIPIVDLLTLTFDLGAIHEISLSKNEVQSKNRYNNTINPIIDMAALVFDLHPLKEITSVSFEELRSSTERNVIEGALISIENDTGYIKALVGGSRFDQSNQYIRATQSRVQPGSSFKPLYYSAAIDTKQFTAASLIYDLPTVFHNSDGTPYFPENFRGEWSGPVLLYDALSQSMNVPSIKILDAIGFDAAIDRAATLLRITDPDEKRSTFPRLYPLGLGTISVSPLEMARAFSVFANQGKQVDTIAIRSIEDRNGRTVLDPERELRLQQRQLGDQIQIISPENAYIMTTILKKTVESGTLASGSNYVTNTWTWFPKFNFTDENGKRFTMPAAGKTGTTQNWLDAWAVGFTPYYTTAIWFGFDKPGNTLGVNLTGSTLAGPTWGDFMREIHQGLPFRDFVRPSTGLIDVEVCRTSGLLPTPYCSAGKITLPFLVGTQPTRYCDLHEETVTRSQPITVPLDISIGRNVDPILDTLTMPRLPEGFEVPPYPRDENSAMDLFPNPETETNENALSDQNQPETQTENPRTPGYGIQMPSYNPLLD